LRGVEEAADWVMAYFRRWSREALAS
jgi:hypothetical protein